MWISKRGCGETIKAIWQTAYTNPMGDKVIKKIDTSVEKLTKWSKTCSWNVRRKLEKNGKKFAQGERLALNGGSVYLLKKLEKEINTLLDREAQMWGQ